VARRGELNDPLHEQSGPETTWSIGNFSEAVPGVQTPLSWTLWRHILEHGGRRALVDLGFLPRAQARFPERVEDRLAAIFYGRVAGSVTLFERVAAAAPGTSPAAFDQQVFGGVRAGVDNRNAIRRYPIVAVKLPIAVSRLGPRIRAERSRAEARWHSTTCGDLRDPRAALVAACAQSTRVMRIHTQVSLLAQGAYDRVARLAESIDRPGLGLALLGGFGDVEEARVMDDLWHVSRGRLKLDLFIARHGYNAPNAGELSSHSWREQRAPVEQLLATFTAMDEAASPAQRATRAQAERARGIVELRRAVGRASRVNAETLLRTAIYIVRLRQIGKTAFVLTLDVGRRCARVLGEQLVADGRADDVDDIFYLTLDEATAATPGGRELVAFRRDRRAHYKQLTVPEMFDGTPNPIALSTNDIRAGDKVEALGVGAPVTVEGCVRLVLDPSQCDQPLGSGEVLVTTTTDPSWASMFATACALVIDVGGAVSHGAIVARELGIPCVINTKTGTRTFRDGDMVRVDGVAGTVELLGRRS
jgi:pyruvate,water dikinase